jgi:hypothetical protein
MPNDILSLRKRYGRGVFVTILPDGTSVPWKPLSIGEYYDYKERYALRLDAVVDIEDEIFCKCVTDPLLVENIDLLKAGTVSTVVASIFEYSSPPKDPEMMNFIMNGSRIRVQKNVIHSFVPLICSVFPAYKPEEIYAMDVDTFFLRLAQAEEALMSSGKLVEPIEFIDPSAPVQNEQNEILTQKRIDDLLKQVNNPPTINKPPRVQKRNNPSTQHQEQVIITTGDIAEHAAMAYHGHEAIDRPLIEHEMVKKTAPIYQDYLEQMARGEKVRIKTPEERVAEFKKKMEERRKARTSKKSVSELAKLKKQSNGQ